LSSFTADDTTTASAPLTFSAAWPSTVRTPSPDSRRVSEFSARSEPLTAKAEIGQHFGNAAHAGAADADEMNVLDFMLH
jgi:hypothetical protein